MGRLSQAWLFLTILSLRLSQVVRDEGIAIGRLIRKVEETSRDGDSPGNNNVDHWVVSFDGETKEQEVTEKYIGRLVESSETESEEKESAPAPVTLPAKVPPAGGNNSKAKTNGKGVKKGKSPPPAKSKNGDSNGENGRPSTRATFKQGAGDKKILKGIKGVKKGSRSRTPSVSENETVVKVKMNTGTLYLYRGENPRAEFIRTV
jgi:hypothetical protein